MTIQVENEDLEELMKLLEAVSQAAAHLADEGDRQEKLEAVRQGLQSFHTTAGMLGLEAIEQSGLALQDFFTSRMIPDEPVNIGLISPFVSTIKAILEEMKHSLNGNGELLFDVERIIEILHSIPDSLAQDEDAGELTVDELPPGFLDSSDTPAAETEMDEAPKPSSKVISEATGGDEPFNISALKRITEGLGGALVIVSEEGHAGSFQLSFPASEANIQKLQTLLSTGGLNLAFTAQLTQQDSRVEKVLQVLEEFITAFSNGDLRHAQEILLTLAEQQQQAGLYKQVGVLARQLHDSIKGFADSLDPTLVDIVEDKIPDSGTRLEHILKLTENAANTTLDHVEVMQRRNQEEQNKVAEVREILCGTKAVGDKAQKLLANAQLSLDGLHDSLKQTSADLITVLTAQDYQDLTGQIIQKIIVLLKELESNLVNVIRTFGVRPHGRREVAGDELYGPAHAGITSAMHSQDDVDSLLADFGF
jgi:chemotaxis protein CheZ